ncbi:MAG: MFS transporter [Bacteroidetes bacterium GWE2_42_39]|nr:MAG: MFS transporter [Bacteroidetes bacterium GWA2_42_15]OFY02695.1 MAG: MFS transporter [Bacteroidetes bacterium GWE2_42_39]
MNQINQQIGKYRWTICALVFFATTVNYLDRQVLSLLKDRLEVQFNWSDSDYANIVSVFQFVYAISMLFAGRLIDWLGTKLGYAWALIIWSVGAMVHALAKGTGGFMIARGVLGFGESGNFPAAIKTTAEWFPKKERALATGIFNSGSNVGAILAPLTVPWIADHLGWEWAFIIIGGIGFLWLIFWFWLYESPFHSKRVGEAELAYINADADREKTTNSAKNAKGEKISWFKLLKYRQTWAFSFGKFMTDGVWWFFLFWLPAYLKAQYGMTGMDVAFPLAVLYMMSSIGSIGGGWFPMYFINKGYEPYSARMKAMLTIALFPLIVLSAQYLGVYSYWLPVCIIGIGTAAHQAWSANIFTTVSDMFPGKAVASVTGIGGMAGGIGGIVVNKSAGWLFDGYRHAGIAKSWIEGQAANLGDFISKIRSMELVNKHGDVINLDKVELGGLPSEVMTQIQSIDPASFELLKSIQAPVVQANMTTAYTIVFAFCALAYLIAWGVMHLLVPKFKKIEMD